MNTERELTSGEVLRLIELSKVCVCEEKHSIDESKFICEMTSENGRDSFQLDFSRGNIELKYKVQTRYKTTYPLLRLDYGGSSYHDNPKTDIVCEKTDPFYSVHANYVGYHFKEGEPHLHIYREGFNDKWAYPPPNQFKDLNNIEGIFTEFLKLCNIIKGPKLYRGVDTYEPLG